MNTKSKVIIATALSLAVIHAEGSSSSNYSIGPGIADSSGGKATSTNYSDEATVGDIVGVSSGPSAGVTLKSGFIGQLYEARSLAVSAAPAAVVESGTTQLSAVATMDDDTLVRLGGSDAKWAVQAGPLAGITLSGLATAGEVFINAPATVRAATAQTPASPPTCCPRTDNRAAGTAGTPTGSAGRRRRRLCSSRRGGLRRSRNAGW